MILLLFGAIAVTLCSMFGRMAHAYTPKGRVILEKVGRQHGKGAYIVQQEVNFRDEKGSITLIEDWVVENGESIGLCTRGRFL
jgi:glutathionylspermidine synthase